MFDKVIRRHKAAFAPPPRKRILKVSACHQTPEVPEYPDPTPATYFFALLGFVQQWRHQAQHCRDLYSLKLSVHQLVIGTLRQELRMVRRQCFQGPLTVRPLRGLGVDQDGKLRVLAHVFGGKVLACLDLLVS